MFYVQVGGSSEKLAVTGFPPGSQWGPAKKHIIDMLSRAPDECRFLHKGKVIQDNYRTIHDHCIKDKDVVQVQIINFEEEVESATPDNFDCVSPEPEAASPASQIDESILDLFQCEACLEDDLRLDCEDCGCGKCDAKDDAIENIVCDECCRWYHWACVDPPLTTLPAGDWYCASCKNDTSAVILPGRQVLTIPHNNSTGPKLAWGNGMANVGHTKKCTIVPATHRGPIPGISVGQAYKNRAQCGEDGIHRPLIAGIAGNARSRGALSIVLSGGYPDDTDNGDDFTYTGAGGHDRKFNKKNRTPVQVLDQTLTAANYRLAETCDASISETGNAAGNWRLSKGVRVVRGYGLKKKLKSQYAPDEGYRYDGIYKLVKYYPATGKTGHLVWKFHFRRDDQAPAPWTPEGKALIRKLGLKMVFPEYYEQNKSRSNSKPAEKESGAPTENSRKRKRDSEDSTTSVRTSKRIAQNIEDADAEDLDIATEVALMDLMDEESHPVDEWTIPSGIELVMDTLSELSLVYRELFKNIKAHKPSSIREFIHALECEFTCGICQEFIQEPVSIPCGHLFCVSCLTCAIKSASNTNCPICRLSISTGAETGDDPAASWDGPATVEPELIFIIRHYVPTYYPGYELEVEKEEEAERAAKRAKKQAEQDEWCHKRALTDYSN